MSKPIELAKVRALNKSVDVTVVVQEAREELRRVLREMDTKLLAIEEQHRSLNAALEGLDRAA